MTFFRTDDEQRLQEVLAADASDRRKLAKAERDLENLRPAWVKVQERIEQLCAQYQCNDRSYGRSVFEPFWKDRESSLKADIERLVAERDGLTATLPATVRELKARILHRQVAVAGGFGSWVSQISERLPEPLAADITAARMKIKELSDLGEIISAVQGWIQRVGELDKTPVGLLNLAGVIRPLAAK